MKKREPQGYKSTVYCLKCQFSTKLWNIQSNRKVWLCSGMKAVNTNQSDCAHMLKVADKVIKAAIIPMHK